ncbi:hypothetical protein K1719_001891 [Acacia pycnantha]|nr:hypothetical protein K1719_001891 [Acacia pycnantha]
MGGGGVLRTAAKVAEVGVASANLRGVPVALPAEQRIRRASRPMSVVLTLEGTKSADTAPLDTTASWGLDEWDFAHDDGLAMEAATPKRKRPRPAKDEGENPTNFAVRNGPIASTFKAESDHASKVETCSPNFDKIAGSASETGICHAVYPIPKSFNRHRSLSCSRLS